MKRARRRISQLLAVADRPLDALVIAQITRTGSGRVYPVLYEMERTGLIRSEWVTLDGLPRRRVYERVGR